MDKVARIMKKLFILAAFFMSLCFTGCTSGSLKLDQEAGILHEQKMPVKFKLAKISMSGKKSPSGYEIVPSWFSEQMRGKFVNNLKRRAPELFSDDSQAIPLTLCVDFTNKDVSNKTFLFLSFLTLFTVVPGVLTDEEQFDVKIQIGDQKQYTEVYSFTVYEKNNVSLIPFYAFLFMLFQSGSFCHAIVNIGVEAVDSPELQNVFLNMIYRLDKDKLLMLYDDKHGEKVELLNLDE